MDISERRRRFRSYYTHTIQIVRIKRGISQRAFAQMIGVSQSYLSSVENGDNNIGFNNLCKIADGLGMPIRRILELANIDDE